MTQATKACELHPESLGPRLPSLSWTSSPKFPSLCPTKPGLTQFLSFAVWMSKTWHFSKHLKGYKTSNRCEKKNWVRAQEKQNEGSSRPPQPLQPVIHQTNTLTPPLYSVLLRLTFTCGGVANSAGLHSHISSPLHLPPISPSEGGWKPWSICITRPIKTRLLPITLNL